MNFQLTKEQEFVRKMVREFAVNEVEPLAADIDKEHRFPVETVEKTDVKTTEKKSSVRKREISNNNQMILDLYAKGKSNIEIAKELGLGIGEVRLVIDLFNSR